MVVEMLVRRVIDGQVRLSVEMVDTYGTGKIYAPDKTGGGASTRRQEEQRDLLYNRSSVHDGQRHR